MNLVDDHKSKLRKWLRSESKILSATDRKRFSKAACKILVNQPVWQSARAVLLYFPLGDEIDILEIIEVALKEQKTVCLPRFNSKTGEYQVVKISSLDGDLVPGNYGVKEPANHCKVFKGKPLDFVLVPGLGFDVFGHRLGRGKGHYDRLLKKTDGVKCGLAFDCQLCTEIPVAPHDEIVNYLLTPTRWLAV